jgi:hypothetical protein
MVAAGVRYRRPVTLRLEEIYWARQCAKFTAPATTPLFVRDPDEIKRLKDHPDFVPTLSGKTRVFLPYCWQRFAPLSRAPYFRTPRVKTLFLHELRTPSGKRRIVFVESWYQNANILPPGLVATVIAPPTLISASRIVASPSSNPWQMPASFDPDSLTFGQPDANDATHFTIEWGSAEERRVIDGYLGENDQIRFVARATPTTLDTAGASP